MGNPFVHVELSTSDLGKAKPFYQKLFDWQIEEMPGGYNMIKVGEGTGGGMMKSPKPDVPSHWMAYAPWMMSRPRSRKVKPLGGTVCMEATDVMGYGTMGVFQDPTGAYLAVWKPKKM